MAQQVAQLLDEKCKVLDTFSTCQQEVGTDNKTEWRQRFSDTIH